MLGEMDVIEAVVDYLKKKESIKSIHKVNDTKEHGHDIEVEMSSGTKLIIEAKGQTSSDPSSNRYGQEFDPSQKLDHVSKAFYTACSYVNEGYLGGIALPNDNKHRALIEGVSKPIRALKIKVYFVDVSTKQVSEYPS